jgi:hypothetical protein
METRCGNVDWQSDYTLICKAECTNRHIDFNITENNGTEKHSVTRSL